MQAESAVNAVATPTGAPTCPPCVASSAGLAQVSGAQEPGVLGSQPESPVPHASTVPPPVTRQPTAFTHCMCVCTHTPASQPAIVHTLPSVSVHGVLVFGVHWPVVGSQPPLHSSGPGHGWVM